MVMNKGLGTNFKKWLLPLVREYSRVCREDTSSSALARQPLVGPGLLKKLCPFVSVEGDFLDVSGRSFRF
jgi:hypothetical protein